MSQSLGCCLFTRKGCASGNGEEFSKNVAKFSDFHVEKEKCAAEKIGFVRSNGLIVLNCHVRWLKTSIKRELLGGKTLVHDKARFMRQPRNLFEKCHQELSDKIRPRGAATSLFYSLSRLKLRNNRSTDLFSHRSYCAVARGNFINIVIIRDHHPDPQNFSVFIVFLVSQLSIAHDRHFSYRGWHRNEIIGLALDKVRRTKVNEEDLHSFWGEFYRQNFCAKLSSVTSGTEQREEKETAVAREGTKMNLFAMRVTRSGFTCGLTRRKMVELNFRRCSGRRRASLVGFCSPGSSEILEACTGMKALELCKRVLTTSSGQVTTAPAVPATLSIEKTC